MMVFSVCPHQCVACESDTLSCRSGSCQPGYGRNAVDGSCQGKFTCNPGFATIPIPLFGDAGISKLIPDQTDLRISLPTPIPIRGIADMTRRKTDNYYAFATAEEPRGPYLEVTEHTKHYLHNVVNVCIVFVLCLYCYTSRSIRCLRNNGKTFAA